MEKSNKISKIERLTNLLKIDKNTSTYYTDMDTIFDSYNKTQNILKLQKESLESDLAYKWIYDKNTSIKSLIAASRTKEEYVNDIVDLIKRQQKYYEENLEENVINDSLNKQSVSDVSIEIQRQKTLYSIGYSEMSLTDLINNTSEIRKYIRKTITEIFLIELPNDNADSYNIIKNPYLILPKSNKDANINTWNNIIDEAIQVYTQIKKNHEPINIAQSKNPYLNLYMYIKNSYLKNFHNLELFDVDYFNRYKNFNINITKQDSYTLKDAAHYLDKIECNGDEGKTYKKIQRIFNKYNLLKEYKKREYLFLELTIPFSYYLYYSHKTKPVEIQEEADIYISNNIVPIIRGFLENNLNIELMFKYINFINKEFNQLLESFNYDYQNILLKFLRDTIINIYFRAIGLPTETVYGIS